MAKNNYIIQKEKQIAQLKKKVVLDSAYIGAGFVIALHERGFSDDEIADTMATVNNVWTKLAEDGTNPIKYCEELTGFILTTDEQELKTISEYFD